MDSLMNLGKQALAGQQGGNGGGFNIGDLAGALGHAENHAGGSGNSDLFSQGLSFVQNQMSNGNMNAHDLDEQKVQEHHDQAYNQGQQLPAQQLGSAAALQAVKSFISSSGSGGGSGGNFQQKMIGMAMGEAAQMFDKQGGSGDKQTAVQSAAETVMKLMVKNQVSGMIGGGNSGGLGALASKFL